MDLVYLLFAPWLVLCVISGILLAELRILLGLLAFVFAVAVGYPAFAALLV